MHLSFSRVPYGTLDVASSPMTPPATLEDARPGLRLNQSHRAYSRAVVDVVDAVSPAVVHVQVRQRHGGRAGSRTESGVVVSPYGQKKKRTQSISLSQGDGQRFGARLIGRDPDSRSRAPARRDIGAFERCASGGFEENNAPGQIAIAIGNPLGFQSTVTGRDHQCRGPLTQSRERPSDRR